MGIIAASVHANVTIVTAFQLFRILVISIFLVPVVKMFVKKSENMKDSYQLIPHVFFAGYISIDGLNLAMFRHSLLAVMLRY
ncbi:AbrB family transcriptional regulator [Lysinibacillus sp. MHQ-1]|nr:AbrB family transcriptional regulator [Lysinibacillus sp. MHQ-1]